MLDKLLASNVAKVNLDVLFLCLKVDSFQGLQIVVPSSMSMGGHTQDLSPE